MKGRPHRPLVLSVYPTSHGIGYVLFEGPLTPFDWGMRVIREKEKNRRTLLFVEKIIQRYRPHVLVLEDWTDGDCRRCLRVTALYRKLAALAEREHIPIRLYPKETIRRYFAAHGATTKHDIALAIAKGIPALSFQLPTKRKTWTSEDMRQGLYDAAALGIVFFWETSGELPRL